MEHLDLQDAIEWLLDPEPCLVMYGAGVSRSAPTFAPSVPEVLGATIDIVERATGVADDTPRLSDGSYDWEHWPKVSDLSISEALKF